MKYLLMLFISASTITYAGNEGVGLGGIFPVEQIVSLLDANETSLIDPDNMVELINQEGKKAILVDRSIIDSDKPEIIIQSDDKAKTLITISTEEMVQVKEEIELLGTLEFAINVDGVTGTFVPVVSE